MKVRMALHRKSKSRGRRIRRTIYILALSVTAGVGGMLWSGLTSASEGRPPTTLINQVTVRNSAARLVYPYSVVAGGVVSRDEFTDVVTRDGVAAAHYAQIDATRLREARLERPSVAYVSFRLDDTVYWTRKPVNLAGGEGVLSDGEHVIRARCGNLLSSRPRFPVAAREPPEVVNEEVEYPVTPELELPPAVLSPPNTVDALRFAIPAPPAEVNDLPHPERHEFVVVDGPSVTGRLPSVDIAAVPEPSSVVLLGTAVLAFVIILRRRKTRG